MKKIIISVLITISTILTLTGCGGPKYCSVSGCPKETSLQSDYCYQHKCMNTNCQNRSTGSYTYCIECFERAQ